MAPLLLLGATSRTDRCLALNEENPRLTVAAERIGDVCRVRMLARPRPNAAIRAELWLPPARRWSGRYYQMGNGGFAGTIHAETLAAAAARGDAAAATDTGHVGDGFDARWAAHRPDLVLDYAYRSIHVTSAASRRLILLYYGRTPRVRYFMGCSNGGRQALVAASRWPQEWDGIIAGAPAAHWSRTLADFGAIQHAVQVVPGGRIDPARLATLLAVAHRLCTLSDDRCDAVLARACRAGTDAACLSPAQRGAVRLIEATGYPPAGANAAQWRRWIFTRDAAPPSQAAFAVQANRYLFADRAGWTLADYRPADPAVQARLSALLDPGDLTAFLRHGKILSYFGWSDPVLPPRAAVRDYQALAATAAARRRLRAGYRLFMVPGMTHCQGGEGPTAFGQSADAPPRADDRLHDVRRALEAWVEQGIAPDRIIATTTGSGPGATRVLRPVG